MNTESQWLGDYTFDTNKFATGILLDIKNPNDVPLQIRLGMTGGDENTEVVTDPPIEVSANSDWSFISLDFFDFIVLDGGNSIDEVLNDVSEIRIIHNPEISYTGASFDGAMHIDNISPSISFIGVDEFSKDSLVLFPNPATNSVYIDSNHTFKEYSIFNIKGQLVSKSNFIENEIDVSGLQKGIYIVNLTNDEATVTNQIIIK